MKSSVSGKSILEAKVEGISKTGIWLFVKGKEYFLPYKRYPWFENARVSEIYHLQFHHGFHLHWPQLDVDLDIDSLEHPEKYPLIANIRRRSFSVRESRCKPYGKKRK